MHRSSIAFAAIVSSLILASPLASQAPSYTPYGKGCPGAVGVPELRASRNDLPVIGETFLTEVTNLPFLTSGIGITGRSDEFWGKAALPFDLSVVAMPGCFLYTDIRYTRTLLSRPGIGSWSTTIPDDSTLIGQSFYQQAFILDRSVPGLGAIMSNAAHGVMGVLPDLVISSGAPIALPETVPAGMPVTLTSFTLKNQGNGRAEGSDTGVHLSTDEFITSSDPSLHSFVTPALNAGQSIRRATATHVTVPVATTPGSYWIGYMADSTNLVLESNEGNNGVSTPLTVIAPAPDLIVSSGAPIVTPTSVEAGRVINVSAVTVQNRGSATTSGSFSVGYYLSTNTTITTGDRFLVGIGVIRLSAGASWTIAARNLTIPVDMIPRDYYLGIIVDRTNLIPEYIEGNNTAVSAQMTVTAPLADLHVVGGMPSIIPNPLVRPFPLLPAPFALGSFTVRNSGLVGTGNFRIGFYFSTNSVVSTADNLMGSVAVGNIAPGGTATIGSRALATPGSHPLPGLYYMGVIVDDQFVVTESNEGNNRVSTSVVIIN
ncbi:MAG: CARDB domain-containing protein [Planctomycetota bacterium]|jgi:hypothetical protein